MNAHRTLLGIVVSALISPILPAGEQVEEFGNPSRLVIRGANAFSAEEAKRGALADFDVLLAAHPSASLDQYPVTLCRRIVDGYRSLGFPDARATPEVDREQQRVVVHIKEGPRFTAAGVRVTGARTIDSGQLVARLTRPYPPGDALPGAFNMQGEVTKWINREGKEAALQKPVWTKATPAPFGVQEQLRLRMLTKAALADLGFEFCRFSARVVADRSSMTADLLVEILDEGPPPVLEKISFTGNVKNSPADLLKYLEIEVGASLTRVDRIRLAHRLWQSARFVKHEISTSRAASGRGIHLQIDLIEYRHAPPLTADFSPAENAMLKCCDWLATLGDGEYDLAVSLAGPRALEVVMSDRHGVLIEADLSAAGADGRFSHSMVVSSELIGFFSNARKAKLTGDSISQQAIAEMSLRLSEDPTDDKPFSMVYGFTIKSTTGEGGSPFRFATRLAPVFFVAMTHEHDAQCTVRDGQLTVDTNRGTIRTDAQSGKLLEYVSRSSDKPAEASLRVRAGRGIFKKRAAAMLERTSGFKERFDPQKPVSSLVSFLCDDDLTAGLLALLSKNDTRAQQQHQQWLDVVRMLARGGGLQPLDDLLLESANDPPARFNIKPFGLGGAEQSADPRTMIGHLLLPLADKLFTYRTWPWTVWREATLAVVGKGRYTASELNALYAAGETGPLCHLTVAALLDLRDPKLAKAFADRGLERLALVDFRNDVRVLLSEHRAFGAVLLGAAKVVRQLDDEQAELLGKELFGDKSEFFVECVRILRTGSDQPLEKALPDALDRLWQGGLSTVVTAALSEISARHRR